MVRYLFIIMFVMSTQIIAQDKTQQLQKQVESLQQQLNLLQQKVSELEEKVADQKKTNTPMKIAFIDLKRVFENHPQVKNLRQVIHEENQEALIKVKVLETKARELLDNIALFRPGSKIRRRKERELAEIKFELEHRRKSFQYHYAQKMNNKTKIVYSALLKNVRKYAQENNIDIVIKVLDEKEITNIDNYEVMKLFIQDKVILKRNKEYDITDEFIKALNNASAETKEAEKNSNKIDEEEK